MYSTGQVGIGTSYLTNFSADAASKLFVEGNIRARKVKVDVATWPDYVFHRSYKLRPLAEVKKFIEANNHLPEVPSATTVKKEGIDLGENQAVLLKKIEELTLYIIAQQQELDILKMEVKELKLKENNSKK